MFIRHTIRRTALTAGLIGATVFALGAAAPNAGASARPDCFFGPRERQSRSASPNCGEPKALVYESLASSANPITMGQSVTFTVSTSPQTGTIVPSGTVTFSSIDPVTQNLTALATVELTNGIATWTTSSLPVGTDGLEAAYNGSLIYNPTFAIYYETVEPAAPVVTSISPKRGSVDGGTVVTVTGANLDSATGIALGAVPATSFSCPTSTTCTFVTPAGTGHQNVQVTNPTGTNAPSKANRFNYRANKP